MASKAGVSPATVSRVLNGNNHVHPELRRKVLDAARDLHYTPDYSARSLSRRRTATLGLLLPDVANPFFAEIARGVEDASAEAGYTLLIGSTDGDPLREEHYVASFQAGRVDGVLFAGAHLGAPLLEGWLERGVAVGLVDRLVDVREDVPVDAVLTDNVRGGALAVRHLVSLGHDRLAVVTGPLHVRTAADRLEGARRAAAERGVTLPADRVVEADFKEPGGYEAARVLFSRPDPPTAVFAQNDMMALGILRYLEEAGLRVPDDVAVCGFDDIAFAALSRPALTTVAQPKYEMGRLAAELLVQRLASRKSLPRRLVLQPRLVLRRTTVVRKEEVDDPRNQASSQRPS
ncbi:LacI family DNA-binding transcriptional regulator [Limnochorda pilosa]|uniref:LacI family transcriptional regulator n=1 Tax=Limnochorda pilosa TaxID=1555112 RepID=A0A0K2SL98_LIMPI|nr:LacI family DNA-binding transcriptional regulator [Limnochorda pilosa]BAS27772.1 LacI family transcriptional regulator [Limnochorda pilosa]